MVGELTRNTCQVVLLSSSGIGGPLSHFDPAHTACGDYDGVGGRVGQNALLALRVAQQVMMMMFHQFLSGVVVLLPTSEIAASRHSVGVSAGADRLPD